MIIITDSDLNINNIYYYYYKIFLKRIDFNPKTKRLDPN